MQISTERLSLRLWKESDLKPFAALNADPKVMEFFPKTLTQKESDALAAKIQQEFAVKGYGLFAVEVPGVAPFIGFIGLHYQDFPAHFTPCVEVGWRLAKEYWGQGYATEGAKAAIDFGFNTIELKEIVSFTSIWNIPSRRVMEKLGMIHDPAENFEHPALPEGHPLRLHVLYRLQSTHFGAWQSK